MPRPPCCRRVAHLPPHDHFVPVGAVEGGADVRVVGLDEYEALRLADVEHLPHDVAAEQMGVSRQTFGRILDAARHKVAGALVEGLAILFEGGPVCPPPQPGWRCARWGDRGPASPGLCPRGGTGVAAPCIPPDQAPCDVPGSSPTPSTQEQPCVSDCASSRR